MPRLTRPQVSALEDRARSFLLHRVNWHPGAKAMTEADEVPLMEIVRFCSRHGFHEASMYGARLIFAAYSIDEGWAS